MPVERAWIMIWYFLIKLIHNALSFESSPLLFFLLVDYFQHCCYKTMRASDFSVLIQCLIIFFSHHEDFKSVQLSSSFFFSQYFDNEFNVWHFFVLLPDASPESRLSNRRQPSRLSNPESDISELPPLYRDRTSSRVISLFNNMAAVVM
jgi:hypothetical protein